MPWLGLINKIPTMDFSWTKTKKIKIEFHCFSANGHAIPMLRIMENLQKMNPNFEMTFVSSKWLVEKQQSEFPQVKMLGVNDYESQKEMSEIEKKHGLEAVKHVTLKQNKKYFDEHQGKEFPDLYVCDIFAIEAMRFAIKHNIKYIVMVNTMPYECLMKIFSFPTLERSFGIGGFTASYPIFFNNAMKIGFQQLAPTFKNNSKILFHSAIGLERAKTIPSNHQFMGIAVQDSKGKVSSDVLKWIEDWKKKEKDQFLYISFGSALKVTQKFKQTILKSIQMLDCPTIFAAPAEVKTPDSPLLCRSKWIQQQAILKLPEIKCFVSHGGWGCLTDAVAGKVPVVCIPCINDQGHNAELIEEKNIGVKLGKSAGIGPPPEFFEPKVTALELTEGVRKVMNNKSFYDSIVKINAICGEVKSEQVVNDAVHSTLKFGNEHLVDKNYEKVAARISTWPLLVTFILMAAVIFWLFGKSECLLPCFS